MPYFVPAYVNLADLERALGRDEASVARLREAVALAPDAVSVRHALGLALHRAGQREAALEAFDRADAAYREVTAIAGSGTISLAGGSVGAGSSCTLDVDVTSASEGMYVNTTGDLTSSSGSSGTGCAW